MNLITLQTKMENENQSFSNNLIFFLRSWSQIMVYVTMISGKGRKHE